MHPDVSTIRVQVGKRLYSEHFKHLRHSSYWLMTLGEAEHRRGSPLLTVCRTNRYRKAFLPKRRAQR